MDQYVLILVSSDEKHDDMRLLRIVIIAIHNSTSSHSMSLWQSLYQALLKYTRYRVRRNVPGSYCG